MKIKHLIYILFAAAFLPLTVACNDEPENPEPVDDTTERTVLVYMVAQNNLSGNGSNDLAEMLAAAQNGHLGKSRLLVYCDMPNADPTLSEITATGRETLLQYDDETLSVSRERLETVIEDAKTFAPANKYGLIMWGHGTGYVQDGIDETDIKPLSYGGESVNGVNYWMNVTTMAGALEGKGFDWVYFDCCFMAGVEVAYELRNVTDYIIASATELPAEGMPYHKTLQYLMPGNSDLTAAANSTFEHFDAQQGMYRTCTMSVIKTEAIDELAGAMRTLYAATDGLPDGYQPQAYQTDSDHRRYNWSYYDLEHYAMALAGDNTANRDAVTAAIGQAVTAAYATPMLWSTVDLSNHSGLSTLIIESSDDPQLDKFNYRELAWWTDVVEPRFN